MNYENACLRFCLYVGFIFFAAHADAQVRKISGKVSAEDDANPLVGVSILIKGTNVATQTSSAGTFNIQVSDNDVLAISYTGYASQEIAIKGAQVLNVSLKPIVEKLSEVVVVGYGTQKKKEFSGAASTVNPLATKFTPSSNVGTALQGTVPGIMVRQTTGAPGSTPSIVFRGGTGFDGSGEPMVVLDGVVVPSLYGIDMNDVESIDVLKDAASTAIYGARAANGVILVTTKKGKKGKGKKK